MNRHATTLAAVVVAVLAMGATGTHTFTVNEAAQSRWGLAYPCTYEFQTEATQVLKDGVALTTTSASYADTNGAELVRFGALNRAFVSVAFDVGDPSFTLTFTNDSGVEVPAYYVGQSLYYDNRVAACTLSGDDWCALTDSSFAAWCDTLQVHGLWGTVGITVGGLSCWPALGGPDWPAIQAEIDEGYVEPAGHGFWHVHAPYDSIQCDVTPSYYEEIVTTRDSILTNITPPLAGGKLYMWIEPYGESDSAIRDTLGYANYLGDRRTTTNTLFYPSFDDVAGLYERMYTSIGYDSSNDSIATIAMSRFDTAISNGGIWSYWGHPRDLTDEWPYISQVLDYVSGRSNIWYVGLGHLHAYRYLTESGVVSHEAIAPDNVAYPATGGSQ